VNVAVSICIRLFLEQTGEVNIDIKLDIKLLGGCDNGSFVLGTDKVAHNCFHGGCMTLFRVVTETSSLETAKAIFGLITSRSPVVSG
jgi:hypothetical protein